MFAPRRGCSVPAAAWCRAHCESARCCCRPGWRGQDFLELPTAWCSPHRDDCGAGLLKILSEQRTSAPTSTSGCRLVPLRASGWASIWMLAANGNLHQKWWRCLGCASASSRPISSERGACNVPAKEFSGPSGRLNRGAAGVSQIFLNYIGLLTAFNRSATCDFRLRGPVA